MDKQSKMPVAQAGVGGFGGYRRARRAKEPKVSVPVTADSDHCGNLRSFYNAVRRGGQVYPSHIDGGRAVAVVFAAEGSAITGRAAAVPQI